METNKIFSDKNLALEALVTLGSKTKDNSEPKTLFLKNVKYGWNSFTNDFSHEYVICEPKDVIDENLREIYIAKISAGNLIIY